MQEVKGLHLVSKGAELQKGNVNDQTPLIYACRQGHLDQVMWLHDQGGDLLKLDKSGRSLIHEAAGSGHLKILKWACECFDEVGTEVASLKEYKAIINKKDRWGKSPLHLASYYQREDCVQYLIDRCGANIFTRCKLQGNRPATTAMKSPIYAPEEGLGPTSLGTPSSCSHPGPPPDS